MSEARFILSKKVLGGQVKKLEEIGLKISYSYKTNRVVGRVLQELNPRIDFSVHSKSELGEIEDKLKIWFFIQAESVEDLVHLIHQGVEKFVVDNIVDYKRVLEAAKLSRTKIILSLRMKFQEHRVGTGKYFVYGFSSKVVREIISGVDLDLIKSIGVHLHRKSQNISEWNIKEEIVDSLGEGILKKIDFVNFGGGLPSVYKSNTSGVFPYIFKKIKLAIDFLKEHKVVSYIEPGRFICAPAVKLEAEIIQVYDSNIIINTSIYNCALDTLLTGTRMLVEGELSKGKSYLIKGNSPTRDDIFRYKVYLDNPNVGGKIIFLNAGAYNYTTDFFGHNKLNTVIVEDFS